MLIVVGTGLLKGNVSVIVGQLYTPEDQRRDAGFSIFYMGINLGAFLAPLVCGYLGQRVSWHTGFAAAGVGMTLGVIQYACSAHVLLGDAGLHPCRRPRRRPSRGGVASGAALWGGLFLAALAVVGLGGYTGALPITAVGVADAAGVLLLLVDGGLLRLAVHRPATGPAPSASASSSSPCCSSPRRSSGRCSSRPARR